MFGEPLLVFLATELITSTGPELKFQGEEFAEQAETFPRNGFHEELLDPGQRSVLRNRG